ncbi:MAG: sel1 repeat family protein [Prevotella sp.]|nr:sel1 repeat family protein [Prevotella sp.]
MKKLMTTMFALLICMVAGAQQADKLYEEGKALYDAKKYEAAVPKLKAAAEKGHKKAQYRLGLCYDKGRGVKENDVVAFGWYQKAAAQNHAKAQFQLGKCYKNGEGTKKDIAKAVTYFTKSANQGNADAQYQLAKCYFKGKGVKADSKQAKAWLQKAVKNEKGGDEVRAKMKKDAAAGDEDDIALMKLL